MTSSSGSILDDDRWLPGLPKTTRDFVRARARLRKYKDGATIYATGDRSDGLYRVAEGEVRLVSHPVVGREVLLLVARPGHWFGELSVIDGGPRPNDAICRGPVSLLHLAMHDIVTFARTDPTIYGQVALIGCAHQREALELIGTILTKSGKARLIDMILGMLPSQRGEGKLILRINQEDLAGRVGVSRQHLSNLLTDLKRTGVLSTAYGCIFVHKRQELAAMAEQ